MRPSTYYWIIACMMMSIGGFVAGGGRRALINTSAPEADAKDSLRVVDKPSIESLLAVSHKDDIPLNFRRSLWSAIDAMEDAEVDRRPLILGAGWYRFTVQDIPRLVVIALDGPDMINRVCIAIESPGGERVEIQLEMPVSDILSLPIFWVYLPVDVVEFGRLKATGTWCEQEQVYFNKRERLRESQLLPIPDPSVNVLAVAVMDSRGRRSTYLPLNMQEWNAINSVGQSSRDKIGN